MLKKILFLFFFVIIVALISPKEAIANHTSGSEYQLPYPGILPDHPAYIIKSLRDNIEEFFISDPLLKAGYNLTKADVRISAALILLEQKNNTRLVVNTLSEAENYYQTAYRSIEEANSQGINSSDVSKKYNQSRRKYLEVLNNLPDKLEDKDLKSIEILKKTH